jgi:hypothetical protein
MEEQFPETVTQQPEVLAYHCTKAGLNEQVVDYWQQAGERVRERSAHPETIGHLSKGIALLRTLLENTARYRHELAMQTTLGLAFLAAKGQGALEVERTLTRARALCHHVDAPALLFRVLLGLRRSISTAQPCGLRTNSMRNSFPSPSNPRSRATSLARLWHQQGKRPEAYGLLAPVSTWFTEGFDTADFQEAKALLDALQA